MNKLIATHFDEWGEDGEVNRETVYLYQVADGYEVDYKCEGTSGGENSTCWNSSHETLHFANRAEISRHFGPGFLWKPVNNFERKI